MSKILLLDSQNQKILFDGHQTDTSDSIVIEHQNFSLLVPNDIVETLDAKECYLSPISFLASMEHTKALYIIILEKHIYIALFDAKKPLLVKIFPLEEKSLAEVIEELLHEFYQQKGAFFVEQIIIYQFNRNYPLDKEALKEKLLLDVEVVEKPVEELIKEKSIDLFCIRKKKLSFFKEYKNFLIVAFLLLLILILYDLFIRYQIRDLKNKRDQLTELQAQLANKNNELQSQLVTYKRIEPYINRIVTQNTLISSQIKEIFDTIPDHSFLTYFEYDTKHITLKGITKDPKEIRALYKKLLKTMQQGKLHLQKGKRETLFTIVLEKASDYEE